MQYLELIKHLTIREIKARYKQSFLGFFWIILNPFFQMVIMAFVFSFILRPTNLGIPYPLFLYAALLPWIFFNHATTSGMNALVDGAGLIKKIYFPREILVLSTILAKLFDMTLSFGIFFLMMLFYGEPITWHALLFIPIFFIQFLFTLGVALLLSVMNLFYRDIQYVYSLILQLGFYLTPIVYAVEFFPPEYRWIFKFNPLSVLINAYRQVLLAHDVPNLASMAVGILVAVVVFFVGYTFFKKMEGKFADIV